jgi:DNA invertase Pin-like site-specific DNA recombinase
VAWLWFTRPSRPTVPSLWAYADNRGWDDVRVVSDLDALMRLVRLGKVQVVLCPGLNGLGRSLSHLKRVIGEFVTHKVGLIVPSLGIKSAGDVSVLLAVLDSIEAFKASVAQERINAGLAGARQRGVKLGRPTKVNLTAMMWRDYGRWAHWSRYRERVEHPEFERLQANQGNEPLSVSVCGGAELAGRVIQ